VGAIPRVVAYIQSEFWAIEPRAFETILSVVEARVLGEARTVVPPTERPQPSTQGSIAVLPIHGVLVPHADIMTDLSGGTSVVKLAAAFDAAVADPSVSAIVLAVHSPGGAIFGIPEFADRVYQARGTKPIVAIANMSAASGAYWIATQADTFAVTPSGEVGSIGVFTTHEDWSKFWDSKGISTTYIQAGEFKTEGHPHAPLSESARAYAQRRIDGYYTAFVDAVARGRHTSAANVREAFGGGRMVGATDALARGMVDRIATLEQVISDLAVSTSAPRLQLALTPSPATRPLSTSLVRRRLQLARLMSA
jgi:capsid assembly protease